MNDNDDESFFEEPDEDPVVNDDENSDGIESDQADDPDDQSVIPFIPEEIVEDAPRRPVIEEVVESPPPRKVRPSIEVVEERPMAVENAPVVGPVQLETSSKPSFFEWMRSLIPFGSKPKPEDSSSQDPVKSGPSYIERKFGNGSIVAGAVSIPPKKAIPRPIPQPPSGLIERAKYKFTHYPAFAWLFYGEEELKRQEKTGLTPRQRIKRYNAVHEGGYGKPIGPEKGDSIETGMGEEEDGKVSETV